MHVIRRSLALLFAVALILVAVAPVAADITVGEAPAGITGSGLMELNADTSGYLYASDYNAPAILKVNAANGQYTRYVFSLSGAFLVQPGDAKPDTSAVLWWSDYNTAFGKLTTSPLQVEYWDLASKSLNPGGFAFDAAGRIWFTQPSYGQLLRFVPTDRTLCRFSVGGGGDYLIAQGAFLWLTDRQAGRLLRFDSSTNQLRAWTLPSGWLTPEGLALDEDGRVWWADSGQGVIGRLTPSNNQLVLYTLPAGSQPVLLAPRAEVIWYTDGGGSVGFIDPAVAVGSAQTPTVSTSTVSPTDCEGLGSPTVKTNITQQTGTLSFASVAWASAAGSTGVTRYALPSTGITPQPWGVASSQSRTWIVDQNRSVLGRTPRLPASPTLSIALETGGNRLTWSAVTKDEGNEAVVVSSYQVWRANQAYFRPWDTGAVLATTTGGTNVPDATLATPGTPVFYGVRSVAQSGLLSHTSAHAGAFAFALVR